MVEPSNDIALTDDVVTQVLTGNADGTVDNSGTGANCNTPSLNCVLYRGLTGTNNGGSRTFGIYCQGLGGCLIDGNLSVGTVNVQKDLDFPLSNLKLETQNVVPNCFGSARFC